MLDLSLSERRFRCDFESQYEWCRTGRSVKGRLRINCTFSFETTICCRKLAHLSDVTALQFLNGQLQRGILPGLLELRRQMLGQFLFLRT